IRHLRASGFSFTAAMAGAWWPQALMWLAQASSVPSNSKAALSFAAARACEKQAAWQPTLQMLQDLKAVRPTSSSYMMALSSAAKCRQWQVAVFLLQQMPALQLPADTVAYNSA
ncbi:HERC4, partial [Symbiodinium microadriaticum]